MESEDIDLELFDLAREWMSVSKASTSRPHSTWHIDKPTDVALWKQHLEYRVKKG